MSPRLPLAPDSLEAFRRWGPDAPARLNAYAIELEEILLEMANRRPWSRHRWIERAAEAAKRHLAT